MKKYQLAKPSTHLTNIMQPVKQVSIIMYHYVRELENSPYPDIKGLSVEKFRGQLEYILKHYQVISMEDIIAAITSNHNLPRNALLLTFDDGYIDHIDNVFPILNELGIQGSFFPSHKAVLGHTVLDINKIHFVLCKADSSEIVKEMFSMLDELREEYKLMNNQYYVDKLAVSDRLDKKDVVFIKRMLQRDLPEVVKEKIVSHLFRKYVTEDEETFSRGLYMNIDQIRYLKERGMFIGSHGSNHCWLNTLDAESQEREIDLSLQFLQRVGMSTEDWVMCYPFGTYDDSLLSILKKKKCAIGLTTEVEIADLNKNHHLLLPRLDTVDLPMAKDATPNSWTIKATKKNN